jgi:hypothetical protein
MAGCSLEQAHLLSIAQHMVGVSAGDRADVGEADPTVCHPDGGVRYAASEAGRRWAGLSGDQGVIIILQATPVRAADCEISYC